MKLNKFVLFTIFHFYILLVFVVCQPNSIQVGFENKLTKVSSESFNLTLIIFSGSNSTLAGEFNLSYPINYINLTRVTAGQYWTIVKENNKYLFYRTPPVSKIEDRTTLAVFTFKRKVSSSSTKFNVSITLFKAANEYGKDLVVDLINENATVFIVEQEESSGGGFVSAPVAAPNYNWVLVGAIAVASVIVLSALYLRSRSSIEYFLIGNNFSISVSKPDTTFGREDFLKFLSADKLSYITRKSKGGQFRIKKFTNGYYIIDNYSTNGTYVNGVNIKGRGYVPIRNGDRISIPNILEIVFSISNKR